MLPTFSLWDGAFAVAIASAGIAFYYYKRSKKEDEHNPFMARPASTLQMAAPVVNTNFIQKMKSSGKKVAIFYGTQTGTAEQFASRLAKDAKRLKLGALLVDPESCSAEDIKDISEIENSLLLFCMATYGEGDPTDNAQELWDYFQNTDDSFEGVNFAVFGLGNKTYENYNDVGKFIDKKLGELGGERVCDLGLGDDDANIEEDFINWCEKLWPSVCERFHIVSSGDDISLRQFKVTYYDDVNDPPANIYSGEPARIRSFETQKPPFDQRNPFLATMTEKRELHTGGDRSCLHIEFCIEGSKLRYEAGSHVAVFAQNDPELVTALIKRLKVDPERIFTLNNLDEEAGKKHPFPCPTRIGTALTHYLDLQSPPRTNVLREMMEFSSGRDKDYLKRLTGVTDDGKALYSSWVLKDRRDILTILNDLPSLDPPIDLVMELLPRLQPRYYSISSSPKPHPNSIHITAVLVDYVTPTGRRVRGVATNFLARHCQIGDRVPIFVRRSQFALPFKSSVPVVMVGPGTGLAPFRGFIQDRQFRADEGRHVGETTLFFGCRNRDHDYLYREELTEYKEKGTLAHLHVAFSRETSVVEKRYVQHMVREQGAELWDLLKNKSAHFYVCGDARRMAPDVYNTLIDICVSHGEMTRQDATDYLKRLSKQGRYSADVWS